MKVTRKGLLAVALAAVVSVPALAAGLYSTFPIVGGAAFCASTVSGTAGTGGATGQGQSTTGSFCAQTVPAGPSVVTGNELIPADEPSTIGGQPQTVVLTLASLNALPIAWVNALTASANTVVVSPLVGGVILSAASAIATTTVTMPASPIDGQQFSFGANQSIASLTITTAAGSGQGLANNAATTAMTGSATAAYGYTWIWHAANSQWWRLR